ncbi:MAG: hypothetical protein WCI73_09690 [Phycisphaerae bacterium]
MKELRDAILKLTLALPNGAANATTSPAIDTGASSGGNTALSGQDGLTEYLLSVPALTTTQQPDAKTLKYDIIWADNAALTTNPVTYIAAAITQTGAGGAGAAAATFRFRLPSTAKRYVGFKATGSASGDSSAASATLEALF